MLRPAVTFPALLFAFTLFAPAVHAAEPNDFRRDAEEIERVVNLNYAYLERFPGHALPMTPALRAEAAAVNDARTLTRYAERALLLLADHHAITGRSRPDSWAVIPTYADLWLERRHGPMIVDAVRRASPAAQAGIHAGDRLLAIDDVPIDAAVTAFWSDLGVSAFDDERAGFAARVMAAGRRDRARRLTLQSADGAKRTIELPSLYAGAATDPTPITTVRESDGLHLVVHNALGDDATIAAFDAAMAGARPKEPIILDLRETPSGGKTTVARAMLGWFVTQPTSYQVHNFPREERETGIGRQWIEQVLPRGTNKYHTGSVVVLVGRWTGSMGEGLAIAFDALGGRVVGDRMAGLLGAIEDYTLPHSGLVIKLPTERLFAVNGTPREKFQPTPSDDHP